MNVDRIETRRLGHPLDAPYVHSHNYNFSRAFDLSVPSGHQDPECYDMLDQLQDEQPELYELYLSLWRRSLLAQGRTAEEADHILKTTAEYLRPLPQSLSGWAHELDAVRARVKKEESAPAVTHPRDSKSAPEGSAQQSGSTDSIPASSTQHSRMSEVTSSDDGDGDDVEDDDGDGETVDAVGEATTEDAGSSGEGAGKNMVVDSERAEVEEENADGVGEEAHASETEKEDPRKSSDEQMDVDLTQSPPRATGILVPATPTPQSTQRTSSPVEDSPRGEQPARSPSSAPQPESGTPPSSLPAFVPSTFPEEDDVFMADDTDMRTRESSPPKESSNHTDGTTRPKGKKPAAARTRVSTRQAGQSTQAVLATAHSHSSSQNVPLPMLRGRLVLAVRRYLAAPLQPHCVELLARNGHAQTPSPLSRARVRKAQTGRRRNSAMRMKLAARRRKTPTALQRTIVRAFRAPPTATSSMGGRVARLV